MNNETLDLVSLLDICMGRFLFRWRKELFETWLFRVGYPWLDLVKLRHTLPVPAAKCNKTLIRRWMEQRSTSFRDQMDLSLDYEQTLSQRRCATGSFEMPDAVRVLTIMCCIG